MSDRLDASALSALLERGAGRRIVCVGDLVLDRFVYGETTRVSREAPVPAFDEVRRVSMLGAAGNVARNVQALGGAAILCGVVGDDAEGHELSATLASEALTEVELVVEPNRFTPVKTRFVASNQQVLCVNRDPSGVISAASENALIAQANSAIEGADLVILSDYGRGSLTERVCAAVIAAARAANVRVVTDPRGRNFARYDGSFIIKPNAQELALEAGGPVGNDAESEAALRTVKGRLLNVAHLMVTRGARGIGVLSSGADEVVWRASSPRDVYDVSGAGDTTIAALGLALAGGAALLDAIDLANRAAGIVVTKIGTAVVRAHEIIEDARADARLSVGVTDLASARDQVARWRAKGKSIGLTNGCFDVLHVGHLTSLERARAECDRLIVAINSDASVTRLKGAGRPVNTVADRARLIASLAPVDLVVAFAEDTAISVIEALEPDVYVKGGDYSPETLPEAGAVMARGGRIVIVPLEEGHSTTRALAKLEALKSS